MQQAQQSIAVERRSPVAALGAPIVNDTGLLNAEQIPAFRAYLVESGLQVRDSGAGQFFHVRLPELARWLPIERGRAGAPVTPDVLRPFIASFLKLPLATAIGEVRAARQAAERAVARTALVLPVECAPVEGLRIDPANGQDKSVETVVRCNKGAVQEVIDIRKPAMTDDAQYLSDLRDDFAVHAPNLAHFGHIGDMTELVRLRWEYADLMMAARTTKAGD